jgi:hypothetical protein
MAQGIIMAELEPNDKHQERGVIKISDGSYVVDVTADGELKVIDKLEDTTSTAGGQKQVFVQDDESRDLLNSILKQLKITNMHLSIITDNTFKTSDVEV